MSSQLIDSTGVANEIKNEFNPGKDNTKSLLPINAKQIQSLSFSNPEYVSYSNDKEDCEVSLPSDISSLTTLSDIKSKYSTTVKMVFTSILIAFILSAALATIVFFRYSNVPQIHLSRTSSYIQINDTPTNIPTEYRVKLSSRNGFTEENIPTTIQASSTTQTTQKPRAQVKLSKYFTVKLNIVSGKYVNYMGLHRNARKDHEMLKLAMTNMVNDIFTESEMRNIYEKCTVTQLTPVVTSSRGHVRVSLRVHFTNYVISEPSYRISGSLASDSATFQVINKSVEDVRRQFHLGLNKLEDDTLAERNRVVIKLKTLVIRPAEEILHLLPIGAKLPAKLADD